MTAGEFARKINVPYTTVATWLRKGQVTGAIYQTIGDFKVWMIPEKAIRDFERPKRGRPKKASDQKENSKKTVKRVKTSKK